MKDIYQSLSKPKVQPVDIDGHTLYVRAMSFGDYTRVSALPESEQITATILACACDADGVRVFSDADAALVEQLPPKVVGALNRGACQLIGFDPDPKG